MLQIIDELINLRLPYTTEISPGFQMSVGDVDVNTGFDVLILSNHVESSIVGVVFVEWNLFETAALVLRCVVVDGTAHDAVSSHLSLTSVAVALFNHT